MGRNLTAPYTQEQCHQIAKRYQDSKAYHGFANYEWLDSLCDPEFYKTAKHNGYEATGGNVKEWPLTPIPIALEILHYTMSRPKLVENYVVERKYAVDDVPQDHPELNKCLIMSYHFNDYVLHRFGGTRGVFHVLWLPFAILCDEKYSGADDPRLLDYLKGHVNFNGGCDD